jgi:hypothetical protein
MATTTTTTPATECTAVGIPLLSDMELEGDEGGSHARCRLVTIMMRPRYSVEIDATTYYCGNVEGVVRLMKHHERTISTGDVFKSLDMKPRHKYRLRERLNGAIIKKIPRL